LRGTIQQNSAGKSEGFNFLEGHRSGGMSAIKTLVVSLNAVAFAPPQYGIYTLGYGDRL